MTDNDFESSENDSEFLEYEMFKRDIQAAKLAEEILRRRERRKQFCKEYKKKILTGLSASDAAVASLQAFGYITEIAVAIVAIMKVSMQVTIENLCDEFS